MESLSTLVTASSFIVLVIYIFVWCISILGLVQAKRLFGEKSALRNAISGSSTASLPGVSILRPLAGLDHNLALNLSSSFEQIYPNDRFEVVLSVKNESDQALPVAKEVSARYPHIKSTIIVGDEPCGVNPKVANLVRPYAIARHDIIWVLDSQCTLSPYALLRAVQSLQTACSTSPSNSQAQSPHDKISRSRRIGLVHHVPLGVSPRSSMGSFVEAIFLGCNHAKMYLAINRLAVESCVVGKSNLWRKSDLQKVPDSFFDVGHYGTRGEVGAIGGTAFGNNVVESLNDEGRRSDRPLVSKGPSRALARFAIYLAEDNMLALSLWRPPLSLMHFLQPVDVVHCSVGDIRSIGDYAARRMRWIRMRKHMVPAATCFEPLTESVFLGFLAGWLLFYVWLPLLWPTTMLDHTFRVFTTFFAFVHFLLWHLVDFEVMKTLQLQGQSIFDPPSHRSSLPYGGSRPTTVIDWSDTSQVWKLRLAWVIREALAFPIWLWAMCGNTVVWRNRTYRLLSDARAAARY